MPEKPPETVPNYAKQKLEAGALREKRDIPTSVRVLSE